jgi:hypothetical protein
VAHRLDGAWEKVNRTHGQFKALQNEIQAFIETRPYRITFDADVETGYQIVRVQLQPIPQAIKWGVQIGEIVHNLRSALEHVVWQATEANGNVPVERVTGFPMCTTRDDFLANGRGKGQPMIRSVSDPVRALIDRLQPFHQRETGDKPEAHVLYVLNELWNIDKHRLLHLCSTLADITELDIQKEGRIQIEDVQLRDPGRIKNETEIARYRVVHDLPIKGAVKVNAKIAYDVALDESAPHHTRSANQESDPCVR